MEQSKYFQVKLNVIIIAIIALLGLPELFDSYRQNAFNTIPKDPYEFYMLHLEGDPNGFLPGSPFTYRVFSIIPAYAIYKILPFAPIFTHLEGHSPNYLEALFAISISNYIATLALAWLVFHLLYNRLKVRLSSACIAALSVLLLMGYTAYYMVDPIVILYLFCCFYYYQKAILWTFLLLIGVGVNEKIPLIFALYTTASLLYNRNIGDWVRFGISVFACLLYLWIRVYAFPMAGYENQVNLASYWGGFLNTLALTLSFKGMYQIILPILITILLAWPLFTGKSSTGKEFPYSLKTAHIGIIFAMILIAYVTNVEYNVGRNVMHLFPVFLPGFIYYLDKSVAFRTDRP